MKYSHSIRIFILCWVTYVCAYICRVNISIALPYMKSAFRSGTELMGVIGSVFFIVYGLGQLVNGWLGDRVSPRRMISIALIGTILMNLMIGFSNNTLFITVFWGINGYFQAMFWGPIMRLLSGLFSQTAHRKVSTGMSSTMVIGYALTWAVLGRVALLSGWRWLFLIPSVLGVCVLGAILLFLKIPPDLQIPHRKKAHHPLKFISRRRLWSLVAACCFMGMIKEGISLWAPMLFSEAIGYNLSDSLNYLLILPIANFCGIFIAIGLHRRFSRGELAPVLAMCIVILFCALVMSASKQLPGMASIIFIIVISAMSFGSNTIFMSMIPLSFAEDNMVSTIAGILDFSTYTGAAISSVLTGIIAASFGWRYVPLIWLIAGGISFALLFYQERINVNAQRLLTEKEG